MTNASHENQQTSPQNTMQYRILKAAVIIMGVLIIVGVSVIIVTLISRAFSDKEDIPLAAQPEFTSAPLPIEAVEAFGDISIKVPEGMALKNANLHGPNILLHYTSSNGSGDMIEVIRLKDGASMGRILLTNDH